MSDRDRTKTDLLKELEHLRKRIAELESRGAGDGHQEALRANEMRYQLLLDTMIHGVQENDCSGVITYSNRAHHRILGYENGELVGKAIWQLLPPGGEQGTLREYLAYLVKEQPKPAPYFSVNRKKDGSLVDLQIDWDYQRDDAGRLKGFISVITDITERNKAEAKLRNVTRLYALLSQINQTIIRTKDRDGLFRSICQVAIEFGRFTMVWAGLIDEATGVVRPVTYAGQEDGYLNVISIRISDDAAGKGPTGSALRGGALSICDDIATDPRMLPWRDEALNRGYRSSAAIPFRQRGKVIGSLNLYAAEPSFFTEDERKLLTEIGVEISFALDTMEGEKERMQVEEALRESERKYRALFDSATDAVFILDLDGNILDVNRTAHTRLGYTKQEMVSMHVSRLDPPEFAARVPERLAQMSRSGVAVFESAHLRKDGSVMPVEINGRLLAYEGRQVYFSIVRDITERKKAEETLRESEERFRTLLAHVDSVAVQGYGPDGVIHYWNRASERLYGYTAEEALGRTILDLIVPGEARGSIASAIAHMATTGSPLPSSEASLLRKDGFRVTVYASYAVVNIPGRAPELYCIDIDITDHKRAEQERLELERRLLYAQKLESLGILAGGIAHDFNNLLMAVLGNLDLALRKVSPVSPARTNIEQSAQAARRATDLTRQMLAYSGKGRFIVKAMDLSELVEENAHLLRSSVTRTATLDVSLGRSLPPIEADAGQVQQMIINLITNASEAIGDASGRIIITTGVQECDVQCLKQSRIEDVPPAGRFVYLEVSDTGCGMDEQTQQRLFDPFFTTKSPGRGLGMSAILGIVRGHGGAIFVESSPGRGTSIRILFPAPEEARAEKEAVNDTRAAEAGAPAMSGTVLVVDDEEIVRMVCKEMVESMGLQVLTAADGREAVDLFASHADSISHVILDLSMPNMDGMAAFTELVHIKPGVKVILSSGYDEQDSLQRLPGPGPAGFIQKPYSLQNLRDALEKAGMAGE
jgi:PAS domain S-box-containing protein